MNFFIIKPQHHHLKSLIPADLPLVESMLSVTTETMQLPAHVCLNCLVILT